MDFSLASNPFLKPINRPIPAMIDPASQRDRSKDPRASDVRSDPSTRDKTVTATQDAETRFKLGSKLAAEQTLKPYGTLMLPIREDEIGVSVMV